jgi:hypothetical protein
MDANQCALCPKPVRQTSFFPIYFCKEHYQEYEEAIKMRPQPEWLRYLINEEKRRRRQRNRLLTLNISFCALPMGV